MFQNFPPSPKFRKKKTKPNYFTLQNFKSPNLQQKNPNYFVSKLSKEQIYKKKLNKKPTN